MADHFSKQNSDGGLRRCDAVLFHEGEQVGGRFQALVHRDAVSELVEREEATRFPVFLSEEQPLGGALASEAGELAMVRRSAESVAADREAEREEVFRGMMGYVFGAGIHPAEVLPRTFAMVRAVRPLWMVRVEPRVLLALWGAGSSRDGIASLWWGLKDCRRGLAGLLESVLRESVDAGLLRLSELPEGDLRSLLGCEVRRGMLGELVDFVTRGGRELGVIGLGRRMYLLGKALAEEEMESASLQVLGDLSDETRAVWSLRGNALRAELEGSGIRIVRFQFQRSTEAVERYREAQLRVWGSGQRPRKGAGESRLRRGRFRLGRN